MPTVTTTAPRSQAFPDPIPEVLLFGTANLLAGAQRVGKTTLLAQWIAAWQTGDQICGFPTNSPTEICYIAADRPFRLHQQLFDKAGCRALRHYSLSKDRSLTIKHLGGQIPGDELLQTAINYLNPKPGALLIIDPLSPFYIIGSALESRAVATTMVHLGRLAEDRELCILGLMHFVKQKGGRQENYARPMDRMSGSGSFAGFSVTQMWLLPPDLGNNQPCFTVGWNPPNGAEQEFLFTRDAWGLFQPFTGVSTASTASTVVDPPRLSDLLDTIRRAGDAGLRTRSIQDDYCRMYKISRAWFYHDLRTLHARGEIDYPRRGWVCQRKVQ